MNSTQANERTGIWTLLPQTVSSQARFIAEAFRQFPPAAQALPTTQREWRERNEAAKAFHSHPMVQQTLNIRPTQISKLTLAGAEHTLFAPMGHAAAQDPRLIVYLHGGGYVQGDPELEGQTVTPLVEALGRPVLSVRYPLWWESPPPADVERVVAVLGELLKEREASSIVLMGTSAGGGLALRSTLRMKALGEPMPAALVLSTPWTDITGAGDTFRTLMPYDILEGTVVDAVRSLLGSDKLMSSPDLSPIYADYPADFPPTIVATGTRDALLSDCARLQRKLTDAGVENELRVFEGMPHGFMCFRMPESDACLRDYAGFIARHLEIKAGA